RSAAAHKLHSATETTRYESDSGESETISRPPALAYSPRKCPTDRDRPTFPESFAILARKVAHLPHVKGIDVWGANLLETSGKVRCRFTTLDVFLGESGIPHVDLLKLDMQGAEYRVLQGGARAFAAGAVDLVYMEIITLTTYRGQRQ